MRFRSGRRADLLGLALLALAAASLAAALARLGWPFELFAHFRWQLCTAAVIGAAAAAYLRRPRLALLAVAAFALPWVATGVARAPATPAADTCRGPELVIASVNLHYANALHAEALQWLESHPADVVVLQEVTPAWQAALADTGATYPHRVVLPREDAYGIAVLARVPLDDVQELDFLGDGLPSLGVTANVGGQPVRVLALHTHWPVLPALHRSRDRVLDRAAAYVRAARLPAVIAGDLNLTPYAPAFRRLLEGAGLRDAYAGHGWRPTWRASFWPLAIPIDHVLVPPDVCIAEAEVGRGIGSDHRPIRVRLRLGSTSGQVE
jgi:endonuclease/exonuclease/phosphatase (EEP) superfamily protein YafD